MHIRKPNHIMNRIILFFLGITSLFLTSCQPTIDASSEESFTASLERMNQSLDEEKKAEFAEAMGVVLLGGFDFGKAMQAAFRGEAYDGNAAADSIRMSLDGLNADQIIAKAESIVAEREAKAAAMEAEREAKKKAEAVEELADLRKKKADAEEAKLQLARFAVSNARFYKKRQSEYIKMEQPIIEMTVTNGTEIAVSRAYFTGTLQSPGRSVPWLKEDFNYSISGGLEPSESDSWSLAPNMFGEWGEVDAPSDAVLTIEAIRLDGPDGESAFDASGFTERNAQRMEEILTEYPDLNP